MDIKYKIIIPLSVMALLAAGCGGMGNTPSSSGGQEKSAPTGGQNVVTYTDSGFSPAVLTIKNGGTVTFKNSASDDMWVASNPHPVHTDYPGFDAKKNIAPGETYQFTFTKSGSWGYHNHLNPSEGGKIIVQ